MADRFLLDSDRIVNLSNITVIELDFVGQSVAVLANFIGTDTQIKLHSGSVNSCREFLKELHEELCEEQYVLEEQFTQEGVGWPQVTVTFDPDTDISDLLDRIKEQLSQPGPPGAKGEAGPQGPPGATGEAGPSGTE